jgi:hypothetical protein
MSAKFIQCSESQRGTVPPEKWFDMNFIQKDITRQGDQIMAYNLNKELKSYPRNSVGALFASVRVLTQNNKDGSNTITGNPLGLVYIPDYYLSIFHGKGVGIAENHSGFYGIVPLIDFNDEIKTFLMECASAFSVQRWGDHVYNTRHIPHMYSNALSSTMFGLADTICCSKNLDKMKDIISSLYQLFYTTRRAIYDNEEVRKIFVTIAYSPETMNVLESVISSNLIDSNIPLNFYVGWIGMSFKRSAKYFQNKTIPDFIETPIPGIVSIISLVPIFAEALESNKNSDQITSDIAYAINKCVDNIKQQSNKYKNNVNAKNHMYLMQFNLLPKTPLLTSDIITALYDMCIVNKKDIRSKDAFESIGVAKLSCPFIKFNDLRINGKQMLNLPTIVNMSSKNNTCTIVPADVTEWTGVTLNPDYDYLISIDPLGLSTHKIGNTANNDYTVNVRFTAGNELMKGNNDGISICGMKYDHKTRSFNQLSTMENWISPFEQFKLQKLTAEMGNGYRIFQNGKQWTMVRTEKPIDSLIAFKYCSVTIQQVNNNKDQSNNEKSQLISSSKPNNNPSVKHWNNHQLTPNSPSKTVEDKHFPGLMDTWEYV